MLRPVGRIPADDPFGAIDWESLATEWAGKRDQTGSHNNPTRHQAKGLPSCSSTARNAIRPATLRDATRWSDDSSAPHRPACSWSSSASGALLTVFAGSHADRVTGLQRQQLPQLVHADPDRDRRELLRDHGGRRDDRDHLRRHRPVGRIDLRAGRRDDGDGAARGRADRRGWRRSRSGLAVSLGVGLAVRRWSTALMVVGLRRPPVHHHARHDVDPARHRVRRQQRREHPAAARR